MTQLAWLTDLHLNFLKWERVDEFLDGLNRHPADAFLISGDLTEAPLLEATLHSIHERVGKPVYFVCGNHDYYRGSIAAVRESIPGWISGLPNLTWLTGAGVIELSPTLGLVGHDGWGDGGYGDYVNSNLILNDFIVIEELHLPLASDRRVVLKALGDEAAAHFRQTLPAALDAYPHVMVVTHVPPFAEASWDDGKLSDDDGLPFFACKAVGDVLLEMARRYPEREIIVLCGHTHSPCDIQILPNLRVVAGQAEYKYPEIQPLMLEIG